MIIIDDSYVCPDCGAYFQDNDYCTNGHLNFWGVTLEKYEKENKPIDNRFELLDLRCIK